MAGSFSLRTAATTHTDAASRIRICNSGSLCPICLLAYRYESNHDGPVGARGGARRLADAAERRLVIGGDAADRSAARRSARGAARYSFMRLDACKEPGHRHGVG